MEDTFRRHSCMVTPPPRSAAHTMASRPAACCYSYEEIPEAPSLFLSDDDRLWQSHQGGGNNVGGRVAELLRWPDDRDSHAYIIAGLTNLNNRQGVMCCAHEVATFKVRQSMIGTCLGKPPAVQCRTFSVWTAGNLKMTCDKSLWATLMTTWSVTKNCTERWHPVFTI